MKMVKNNTQGILPTKANVEAFEMLSPMLASITKEMKELSKKKPDGIMNAFKIRIINRVLEQSLAILSDQPEVEFLELLDDDALPSYSDTVLMLSQYQTALHQFLSRYYRRTSPDAFSERSWHTLESSGDD